jgi:hypothetical protein
MTTYINPYTGQTINPSQVGYESISISVDTTLQWPVNGNTTSVVANIVEVTATVASLNLVMPAATQVSVGQSTLIRNIGSNAFTVTDAGGNTIVNISSGVAQYVYVTSNSTENGTWSSVTFGAGTSAANAATLAGYGLTAIGTTLNQAYPVSGYFSSASLSSVDRAKFVVWSGGVGTITLPSAATVGNNWFCMIRNGGTGILTVTPSGTDTIDSLSSQQLQISNSFCVCSNGTGGYSSFGLGQSSTFTYTQLVLPVTGGTTTLTPVQYANVIQEYTGTLTSNQIIVLPSTVQIYYVSNLTSGAFSLTFKTSAVSALTYALATGTSAVIICDGTNVLNANTASVSSLGSVTFANGSAGAPSVTFIGDTTTGVYLPTTGHVGLAASGVKVADISTSGALFPYGISGGTF